MRIRRLPIASSAKRIQIFLIITGILITLLAGRAIQVQGLDAAANAAAAAEKMTRKRTLMPNRGDILDRDGVPLAASHPAVRVIADPTAISTNGLDPDHMTDKQREVAAQAPAAIAEIFARHLGGSAADYLPQLTKVKHDDGSANMWEVIKTKVPAYTYQLIIDEMNEGGWYGVYKEDDPVRSYPGGTLAANVVGFVNAEGNGGGGFESAFEADLRGVEGLEVYTSAAYGRIPLANNTMVPAIDGTDYTLTIDSELQWLAQRELENALAGARAKSGSIIIMGVKTGEVLAMATGPTFDANNAGLAPDEDRGNRSVSEAYEPGSVQKVLTFAALLNEGIVTPETPVEIPETIASGDGVIRDAWPHGTLHWTARGVLAESSNIGTVMLARQLDKGTFANYLEAFGLGKPTGIELPGEGQETLGIVPNASMPDYTRDQISFGQGLSVTALQEAAAVASVVNGGIYHTPTILRSATNGAGEPIEITRPEARRVISKEASAELVEMMQAVMDSPAHTAARSIPGYGVAAKSGTAQRIDRRTGRYLGYTASFVTVAPVEDPQLLVYVVIDDPAVGRHEGSVVALPPSRNLMSVALPRYGIAPNPDLQPYDSPLTYQP